MCANSCFEYLFVTFDLKRVFFSYILIAFYSFLNYILKDFIFGPVFFSHFIHFLRRSSWNGILIRQLRRRIPGIKCRPAFMKYEIWIFGRIRTRCYWIFVFILIEATETILLKTVRRFSCEIGSYIMEFTVKMSLGTWIKCFIFSSSARKIASK